MKIKISQLSDYFLYWMSLIWLLQALQTSLAFKNCTGDQFTIIDRNKKFVRCAPCPPCPPGQEYTIPCHTTVFEDSTKIGTCINCLSGKFSRRFDTQPCMDCRRCSKRHIKRSCTRYKNAKCGDCLSGYYYSKNVMGCIECGRCCSDAQDQKLLGCSNVGMCKPRPNGCPGTVRPSTSRVKGWLQTNTFVNQTKVHSTLKPSGWLTINKSKVYSKRKPSTVKTNIIPLTEQGTTPPGQTTKPPQDHLNDKTVPFSPSVMARKDGNQKIEDDSSKSIITVQSVVIGIILVILIIVTLALVRERRRERPSFLRNNSAIYYSTPVVYEPRPAPNDRTLKDFMENETDACIEVCIMLCVKTSGGMFDFDRIANKFSLPNDQRQAIKNVQNTPRENPALELMDVLCKCMPEPVTVRQFAKKAADIKRNDVFQKLQPFFEIRQDIEITPV